MSANSIPKRRGDAVKLTGLLELVGTNRSAKYIGLHSTLDDFHASIPLAPVRERAFLIYRLNGEPLDVKAGGPFRFYIPNHALVTPTRSTNVRTSSSSIISS